MANCSVCHQDTTGQPTLMAVGKLFHSSCFVCSICHQPFNDGSFYPHQDQILCEKDFNLTFSEVCHKCNKLIIDGECFYAMEKNFHPSCFSCTTCHILLKGAYIKYDDAPYCRPCHDLVIREEKKTLANACHRCKKQIDGQPFIFRGNKYHAYHFNCTTCKLELTNDCKEHEGKLYCPEDHARAMAPVCFSCRKLIFGQVVNSMGKTFHLDCFCCAKCETIFENLFYEYLGQALCELHYREATGARCAKCKDIIQGQVIEASGKQWCANHFTCMGCDESLAGQTYGDWDGRAICVPCFTRLPIKVRKRLNDYRIRFDKRQNNKAKNRTNHHPSIKQTTAV